MLVVGEISSIGGVYLINLNQCIYLNQLQQIISIDIILKYLKEHAPTERPSRRKIISDVGSIENVNIDDQKWRHQDEAVKEFLEKKNGILAMATGSGKTWTSFKIIDQLFEHNLISQVIITMRGNSLLAQWMGFRRIFK